MAFMMIVMVLFAWMLVIVIRVGKIVFVGIFHQPEIVFFFRIPSEMLIHSRQITFRMSTMPATAQHHVEQDGGCGQDGNKGSHGTVFTIRDRSGLSELSVVVE